LVLLSAVAAFGQPPAGALVADDMLLVQFRLDPAKGLPADDLRAEEIELRIDGKPQTFTLFEGGNYRPRTLPIQVGLLFDCPGSLLVTGALSRNVFHENLLDEFPSASLTIYGFSNQLVRITALTRDPDRLIKGIGAPMFKHPIETFLVTYVENAIRDMASTGKAVRFLAVFSDGLGDPMVGSESTNQKRYDSAIATAQLTCTAIYPVLLREQFGIPANVSSMPSVGTPSGPRATRDMPMLSTPSQEPVYRAYGNFKNLGPPTGGDSMELLAGTNMIPQVLQTLAENLRRTYVVGFTPQQSSKPKRHKIQISLRTSGRGSLAGASRTITY